MAKPPRWWSPSRARWVKLLYAMRDNFPDQYSTTDPSLKDLFALMTRELLSEWGKLRLNETGTGADDLWNYFLVAPNEEAIDTIEAYFVCAYMLATGRHGDQAAMRMLDDFTNKVNAIFDDHDIAWQLARGDMVPRESMVSYAEIVAPTLSLLHGSTRLDAVEKAFQDALRELKPGGDPGDAITDAGTALQEMLVALGCNGNSLGPLLADAKKRGLLGPVDSKLAEGTRLIGEWVSAHRSERGDAHKASDASRSEAWLAVHVVGALILRLEGSLS